MVSFHSVWFAPLPLMAGGVVVGCQSPTAAPRVKIQPKTREGNDAAARILSTFKDEDVKWMRVAFGRSLAVEASVTYTDGKTIQAWKAALARSTRRSGLSDPGSGEKRPFEEGLVRFGLRNHLKVELPLYEEDQVEPRWGREIATLYGSAMDRLQRTIDESSPAGDR